MIKRENRKQERNICAIYIYSKRGFEAQFKPKKEWEKGEKGKKEREGKRARKVPLLNCILERDKYVSSIKHNTSSINEVLI